MNLEFQPKDADRDPADPQRGAGHAAGDRGEVPADHSAVTRPCIVSDEPVTRPPTCATGSRASKSWASCSTSPAPTGTSRSARSPRSTTAASRSAALLFDDIVGYPRGYRVLTGSVSNARRMAVTLGLDDEPRHRRRSCRRCAASRCSGRPPRRDFEPECRRDGSDPRERRRGTGRRPDALPGAAVARARRRPLHRHRRGRGHERSRHRPDQRRRLPDDDPGGRPLGDDQRRSGQAGARAVRPLVCQGRARRRCSRRSATIRCC